MKQDQQNSIVFDELATKYLKPEIIQSFPDVDFDVRDLIIDVGIKELTLSFHARKISVATFLVSLVVVIAVLLRG